MKDHARTKGLCDCGRSITGRQRTRCQLCARADPHRHKTRKKRQIIVSVDCEGHQTPDGHMRLISVSYGREDGTSNSYTDINGISGQHALRWLIDELTPTYIDNNNVAYRQVPLAFHFTWDTSVIARDFVDGLIILHKATAKERGLLCDTAHQVTEECLKIHRRDQEAAQDIISDGGEESLIAYDDRSHIGLATTPRRRLYAEYRPHGDRYEDRKILDIHDTGSSFVGGLLDVIDKWKPLLTPEQKNVIEWGKKARKSGFLDGSIDRVEAYSEAECIAHARCVRLLLNAIKDSANIIIAPSSLFGSGSIAAQAFKYHKVPTRKDTHTEEQPINGTPLDQIALLTYFGGLIEGPVVGLVKGQTDEVDLNSAYPAQMIHLPCMKDGHGRWRKKRGDWRAHRPPEGSVGHVQASWCVDTPSTPPFVVRTAEGLVRQPLSGIKVWVTLAEFEVAKRHFGDDAQAHHTVWWEQQCECPNPLAWLQQLYDKRQHIKHQMTTIEDKNADEWQIFKSHEEAIKLIINSCYGKLAQQRPTLGRYTNLHYASHITGATRALVRKETWTREAQGGTVVYQHTDSVLSINGTPQDGGSTLGAWKLEKQSTDLLIIQPGLAISMGNLHINDEGQATIQGKAATRGCRKNEFAKAAEQWITDADLTQHPAQWPEIVIERTMMISRRMAQARGKPELAGSFLPQPLTITFTTGKRDLDQAYQIPDIPTAWIVPPLPITNSVATINDIKQYQTRLAKRIKAGEFDKIATTPTYDQLDPVK